MSVEEARVSMLASATTRQSDTAYMPRRVTNYGDGMVVAPVRDGAFSAAEGTYMVAMNPTLGTGLAMGIITSLTTTTPLLLITNTESAGGKTIYMDYIKLINTAAGASTTSTQLALMLDSVTRYSSGGTLLTAKSTATANAGASISQIYYSPTTSAGGGTVRNIGRTTLKVQAAPCWTVGDEATITFGLPGGTGSPRNGAAVISMSAPAVPVAIAPGACLLVYMWNVANAVTPPSFEIEVGLWER